MADALKTKSGVFCPDAWLAGIEDKRRAEAALLLDLFGRVSGWEARLWGKSMIGFGRYEYRYDSGHSGEALATGFAVRKADLVVYIMPGYADFGAIMARLGTHKMGKSCLYIKRLSDVDEDVLAELICAGLNDLKQLYPVHPV